jgi:UDP-N-acetylglucosamine 2-epimerase (hydrolysing)
MKKIIFVTGTRADYGKLKPLIRKIAGAKDMCVDIFVSGMHLLPAFGNTFEEVLKDRFEHVHVAHEILPSDSMSENLGRSILAFGKYIGKSPPDMIVVHGDRTDALAGAVTGALNNIRVAHIEGGEVTGTIDESIRHAISKFSHIHFVSNNEAQDRLVQLGERREDIFVIGSPDIDIMMSDELPALREAKERYDIAFDDFAILMFHPVTTEYDSLASHTDAILDALRRTGRNYIIIYPNNDCGAGIILDAYRKNEGHTKFKFYPSLRFEHFLTFLKNAEFIIGNSSTVVREAGIYGIPAIDIGTRQSGRYNIEEHTNIQHVDPDAEQILTAVRNVPKYRKTVNGKFGNGNSAKMFLEILESNAIWSRPLQKQFVDLKEIL